MCWTPSWLAIFPTGRFRSFEMKSRGARNDQQFRHLCQRVNDFFGEAVGEVGVVGAVAHGDEGEDGDGLYRPVCIDRAVGLARFGLYCGFRRNDGGAGVGC